MSTMPSANSSNLNREQEQQSLELSSGSNISVRKFVRGEIGIFGHSKKIVLSPLLQSSLRNICRLLYLWILFDLNIYYARSIEILFRRRISILSFAVLFLLIIPLVNLPLNAAGQAEGT